jgi:hypothetical protein
VRERELEAARSDIAEGRTLLLLACSRFQSVIDRVDLSLVDDGRNLAMEWLHDTVTRPRSPHRKRSPG